MKLERHYNIGSEEIFVVSGTPEEIDQLFNLWFRKCHMIDFAKPGTYCAETDTWEYEQKYTFLDRSMAALFKLSILG